MDEWARLYDGRANFICVSCAGQELSVAFSKRMRLKDCVNSYIESERDMPQWGQLGCSGFIIMDEHMKVVNKCTSAYLEVKDAAFRHVESILDSLLSAGGPKAASFHPGMHLRLTGLTKAAQLNGEIGVCMAAIDPSTGRIDVWLDQLGKTLAVLPKNVQPATQEEIDATTKACGDGDT